MTGEFPFFPGKVGLQQRVLPAYRVPFFQRLGAACTGGLSLYAGEPRNEEAILVARRVEGVEFASGRNVHLLSGSFYLCLQPGVIGWLSHWDPDVLVLEANPRYLSNYAAARWMHRRGRPVIGWGLGASTGRGWKHALTGWWRGPFLSMFDAILAYSSKGADQYRTLGFPPERVFIAFNAVSPPPPGGPSEREAPISWNRKSRTCGSLPSVENFPLLHDQPGLESAGSGFPGRSPYESFHDRET